MSLTQTAEDILRDEFWLDENNYTKFERERFIDLIENYNNRDDEIDNLENEVRNLEDERDDLQMKIDRALDILDDTKNCDLLDEALELVDKAKEVLD